MSDGKYVVATPVPRVEDKGTGRGRARDESGVTPTSKIGYRYDAASPEAYIAKATESELANLKVMLYNGGYYSKSDPPTGANARTQWDVAALKRAMTDANLAGVSWEQQTANQSIRIAAGLVGQFYGETGSRYVKQKTTLAGNLTLTSKSDARDELNQQFRSFVGRDATAKEFKEYYSELTKKQLDPKNAQTTTTRVVNGQVYSVSQNPSVSASRIAESYVLTKMNLLDPALKGEALDTLNTLDALGKGYGVSFSPKQRAQYAKDILSKKITFDNVKSKLTQMAKQQYKGLASTIDENVDVRSAASNYIQQYASTLELDPDTVKLSDVSNAISGEKLMSMSDFVANTRKDARFQYTTQAKQEASSMADGFLRAFGFGG